MLELLYTQLDTPDSRKFMEDCFEEFGILMYTVAKRYVDEDTAAEIVQDACIKLIRHIETIMTIPRCNLAGYIVNTVKNTAKNYLTAQVVRLNRSGEMPPEDAGAPTSTGRATEKLVIQLEDGGRFREIWKQLPAADRDVLEKKYLLEETDEELARELSCKASSVRMKLTRARRKAMELYKEWKNNDEA